MNFHLIFLSLFYPVFCWSIDSWVPGCHDYHGVHNGRESAKSFLNEWTVEVEDGEEVAQLVALELGYVYDGPVIGFPNMYRFVKYDHEKQRRNHAEHTNALLRDRRVRWAEQLFSKSRVKRSPLPEPDAELQRVKRRNIVMKDNLFTTQKPLFNDELWSHEWYLQDTRSSHHYPRLDLNVLPVYKMGYNGSGIRVSVLDDGIEHNHTDLRDNYVHKRSLELIFKNENRIKEVPRSFTHVVPVHDPEISWDSNDGDPDPLPRYEDQMTNSHGTRCAGEIAMTANNVKCGVGVAWAAKVGGVRMLDGRITDRVEAEAIAYAVEKVHIYSASWGPNDDGKTVEGPGRLALEAFKKGITKGRNGKGAIYVWANGNGGGHEDNCNCDGYSSSIYTISIASSSQQGKFPWYGEICSSTLATAYSSDAHQDQKIATTDTGDSCTLKHTGTSAAAPLAAGILALALHANPNLTWRDVQHLIVWTSDWSLLSDDLGWQVNGVGLHYNIRFGFGLMNAGALVSAALKWTTVPKKMGCHFQASPEGSQTVQFSSTESLDIEILVDQCSVNYLEHVEVVVNLKYSRRGAVEIYLTSPQGTKVQLLSARPMDTSKAGFTNWPLMSVATWGEHPQGVWLLTVQDNSREQNTGFIGPISLIIHGTSDIPSHMVTGPTWEPITWQESDDVMNDDFVPSVLEDIELLRTYHRNEFRL